MRKINAYRIVAGNAADQVMEEVNNLLEAGWELRGDLQVSKSGDPHVASVYSQAMVQHEYYEGIDSNILVTIEEIDGIRHALDKIGEALDTAATTLIHMAKTLPPPE